jgi:hypothetical protein
MNNEFPQDKSHLFETLIPEKALFVQYVPRKVFDQEILRFFHKAHLGKLRDVEHTVGEQS